MCEKRLLLRRRRRRLGEEVKAVVRASLTPTPTTTAGTHNTPRPSVTTHTRSVTNMHHNMPNQLVQNSCTQGPEKACHIGTPSEIHNFAQPIKIMR